MDFRLLAIDASDRWNPIDVSSETPDFKQFLARNGFITLFKKRNRFSSRRCHLKRRSPPNPELKQQFLGEMAEIVRHANPERVLNCDEISWKSCANGIVTCADTGSQNIAVNVTGNEKESITVMATITLTETKLPLYLLAEGSTERCQFSQLAELGPHQSDHSSTGWMTEGTMVCHLDWLHGQLARLHGKEQEYDLNMDIYTVHIMQSVRAHAALRGFKVHFIPSGVTDRRQPLDRAIFGSMKATA
jgi:hypothetical protein